MRIPSSRRRCTTAWLATPKQPSAASASAIAAKTLKRIIGNRRYPSERSTTCSMVKLVVPMASAGAARRSASRSGTSEAGGDAVRTITVSSGQAACA